MVLHRREEKGHRTHLLWPRIEDRHCLSLRAGQGWVVLKVSLARRIVDGNKQSAKCAFAARCHARLCRVAYMTSCSKFTQKFALITPWRELLHNIQSLRKRAHMSQRQIHCDRAHYAVVYERRFHRETATVPAVLDSRLWPQATSANSPLPNYCCH